MKDKNLHTIKETILKEKSYPKYQPEAAFTKNLLEKIEKETTTEKILNEGTEIIRLKIWEDLTFSEIAFIMKQKESKIKMIYYRTLLNLKSAII
ncbi:hypothetical protein A2X44_04725 [candidate division CPR3 bacterium GWF2_35_18]|uniref:RNA polymerase sigma factor 70 region 4 type 2 domain-containing protein n=1 Tax=candidate division CPR3 bacterium GW2011_GWF2_35_18 TaxID=1618350 RepID=A0A0G0BJT5_UNCC3|nr:MAG: hypothetical protein UR67_C0003G0027 [candidate division CPR3 bacterium GW2011_GWF2_35_18]KKP86699.1 MAG: hypothetical protein UR87_C0013G0016 [candidate division CPR3 bacterium GW2011_GWE2_35_7]OGB63638.1 MAG: hypothetical protein A2X44_04725 [candidate division CPR3 bacterium GWF2_35_18]OGB64167.1 MAG: hypothetical protein A2250_02520 [candidate division CPR3 bacterium RIFOXYA2_FULL_35_13]OGB75729.1 MAG: hypothetical protein A2476_03435 [candidate division CPR3 bacterium RIFOXYC2_FULL